MKKLLNTDLNSQTLIKEMESGNENAIISGIHSQIPIVNLNAIVFGTKYNYKSNDFINSIKDNFLNSDISFLGCATLGDFAKASLHILNIVEYKGNSNIVNELIESKMSF